MVVLVRQGEFIGMGLRDKSEPMRKLTQYLLAPNAWVGVFSILAVAGLLLCAVGVVAQSRQLMVVGLWLITPIVIGGVVIVLVVFPLLIAANRRHRK